MKTQIAVKFNHHYAVFFICGNKQIKGLVHNYCNYQIFNNKLQ